MFIVIELQGDGETVANIVTQHATQAEAESKYHLVLSAAAVSNVPKHAAIMLSDEGFPMLSQCYKHAQSQE